jgi:LuxR family maltose regulon positive regulatory protein
MPDLGASQDANLLLATKLYVPPPRAHLVQRTRLIERLDESMSGALMLISAHACFGKTTLVADWIKQTRAPGAWVSLDHNDDELARFFAYVIAALETIEPRPAQTVYPLFQVQPTQAVAIENDPVVANKMNSLTKIVFSRTPTIAEWNNTRLVKGAARVAEEI